MYYLFFITFATLNSVWFILYNYFFKNVPTIFSPLTSSITYPHGTVFLTLLITKNSFTPVWNITFWKNLFIFWYSYTITNFKFRIFIITFNITVNICARLYINRGFILIVLWCVLYSSTIASNLLIYTFLILKSCICRFYSSKF